MSLISSAVGSVGGALGLGGQGVAGPGAKKVDPYQVNAAAFRDPNAAGNRAMIANRASGVMAPSAGTGTQSYVVNALKRQLAGQGPSVAQIQMQQGIDAANRGAMGLASSGGPGANPALALRGALNAQSANSQAGVANAAQLRAGEQLSAQQQLQQAATQQQANEIQRQSLVQQYAQLGLTYDQAQQQAQMDLEALKSQNYNAAHGLTTQGQIANQQARVGGANSVSGLIGGIAGAAGAALAMSDKRVKTAVKGGGEDVDRVLDALAPTSYRYKEPDMPGAGRGERLGILAQDLEKTPEGKALVVETPQGKAVDVPGMAGMALASAAHLNARIKALEGGKYASGGPVVDPAATEYTRFALTPNFGDPNAFTHGAESGASAALSMGKLMPKSPSMLSSAQSLFGAGPGPQMADGGPVESKKGKAKVEKTMGEFSAGKLHSGSKDGPVVENRKQAVAIALSQARNAKDGGAIRGPGGPTDDQIPAMLSNGENVWSARDVEAAGGQHAVEALKRSIHIRALGGKRGSMAA